MTDELTAIVWVRLLSLIRFSMQRHSGNFRVDFFRLKFQFSFRLINFGRARTAVAFLVVVCVIGASKWASNPSAWKQWGKKMWIWKRRRKKCVYDPLHNSELSSNYLALVWCTKHNKQRPNEISRFHMIYGNFRYSKKYLTSWSKKLQHHF